MPFYKVQFSVTGTASFVVEADDEDQAEWLAREKADDGFDVDDAEIDECWEIKEEQ